MVNEMRRLGRGYMNKNLEDFTPKFHHKAMSFLTPLMKKLSMIPFAHRLKLYNEIESFISENITFGTSEMNAVLQTPDNIEKNNNFLESFISFDDDVIGSDSELMRYINSPITCQIDVGKWWFEHSSVFPKLYRMFLKISCIPATSASSERCFSTSGNIFTDKRSMIMPNNVNNLIIVRNKL